MTKQIIRHFRVTPKYKGYLLIIDAVELYMKSEKDFVKITKDVYPVLAKKYHMTTSSVERDIRTVVEICWKNDKYAVRELLECNIRNCPTNAEFVNALVFRVKKGKT